MLGLWVRKGRDAKNAIRKESVGKLIKTPKLRNTDFDIA